MIDAVAVVAAIVLLALVGLLAGTGRGRDELRARRWGESFESELHRMARTDATGVLMCRSCGASGSERAGRCPRCGAAF